jgi:hypothetical protein
MRGCGVGHEQGAGMRAAARHETKPVHHGRDLRLNQIYADSKGLDLLYRCKLSVLHESRTKP